MRPCSRLCTLPRTRGDEMERSAPTPPSDFIRDIVAADLANNTHQGRVATRFPPEPNGYLHIGHAKSICLNFGIALENHGVCHLRFDDTNPAKEDVEYVDSIQADVRWLGFDWHDKLFYASDYFQQLHDYAVMLIKAGKAYVDSLSADEIRAYRGTLTEPGRDSPYRTRSVEENLDLFARMTAGEFEEGAHVLRAKIDMASPNINMRDPAIYRIKKAPHHRTGDAWCIYPMYDFAHALSDAIEGITHSICTLEFEDHRPLYDWVLDNLPVPSRPHQYEFARLNLNYTVLSKRKLLHAGHRQARAAAGTTRACRRIAGLRRRGYPPEAIRAFCDAIGVAKRDSIVDVAMLEHAVRDELNRSAPRAMAVLRPLKVVIENYPEGQVEEVDAVNNPEDASMGTRKVPFSRVLYIEQDDFREDPPKQFFRLSPGREVRLRYAYFIRCEQVVKDADGEVVELRCTYDPGDPRRRRARRAQGEGDAALGVGGARGGRRGAALRPAVHRREPERREGRRAVDGAPEPAVARGRHRLPARAEPRVGERRRPLPVRAPRLLLRRRGFTSRRPGVQPHRRPARHLGADREEGQGA